MANLASNSIAASASASTAAAAPQPRLVKAAHEFESQMMTELMKPLTRSSSPAGEDDDSDSGSGGALADFASEALGRAISDKGGFGIANRIIRDLSHSGNAKVTTPVVTGNSTKIP